MSQTIIFLDFDGVLHPVDYLGFAEVDGELVMNEENRMFCWAGHLVEIVNGADCDLVVHSSWRNDCSLEEIRARLPEALAMRVVDVTRGAERYRSIMDYVQEKRSEAYLILDDSAEEFPDNCSELLLCDSQKGIGDPAVRHGIADFIAACRRLKKIER